MVSRSENCIDFQWVGDARGRIWVVRVFLKLCNGSFAFQTILSGVPQGSVLGPILFNVYINDLFLFIKQATLYNYADDNTLAYFSRTLPNLVRVLEEEAGVALDWLKENHMITNPSKFHALLIKK